LTSGMATKKKKTIPMLSDRAISCRVMPAKTGVEEILKEKPDGILLPNGPGDPEASPGPHDSSYLFNKFVELMEEK